MVLTEPTRKGGRYTRKEQEERRIQVYHLHFEENRPAVEIAQLLGVNRNTINDDTAYWHLQLAGEMKGQSLAAKMTKQIQRMEIQRDRLLDDLEEAETLNEKIKMERFIFDIDNRLGQYFSKMILSGKTALESAETDKDEITDDEVKEFVRELIHLDSSYLESIYSENNIIFSLIQKTKCNMARAEAVLKKMKDDGLSLCKQKHEEDAINYFTTLTDDSDTYNLGKFAFLRGYVTEDEWQECTKKRN